MRYAALLLSLLLLAVVPAVATPSIMVNPSGTFNTSAFPIQVDVTGITGGTIVLRLRVDVDDDGVVDPEDYVIWSDVIDDTITAAPEFSPNMIADEDTDPGEVTVRPRLYTPLRLPNAVGNYLWEVEDASASPFASADFFVGQSVNAQSVSGTVRDGGGQGIGGALVVLLPVNEDCDATAHTAFTDATGFYGIELDPGLACEHRVVLAAHPDYIGGFLGQPSLEFTGSSSFSGIDVTLQAGNRAVDGLIKYEDGPRVGQGIPGQFVFAEGDDGFSIGYTDGDGGYDFTLTDGDWSIEVDEGVGLSLQGAVLREDTRVDVTVSGGAETAGDLLYPAANAFISGTLFDDASGALTAQEVRASRQFMCAPDCYETETFTSALDGSFTLGVLGPPAVTWDYDVEPETPRAGLIAEGETVSVSLGSMISQDLAHLTPTSFISGSFSDGKGNAIGDLCIEARSFSAGNYRSRATVQCDGSYMIPAIDGMWNVDYEGRDLIGAYRGLDITRVDRQVTVAGANVTGQDFILGRFLMAPTITRVEPPAAQSGAQIALLGHALPDATGGQVLIGGMSATVVASRPDIGRMVVEVPALGGAGTVPLVVNDTGSGQGSNESCLQGQAGTYTSDCALSGTVTDGASAVADALVVLLNDADDNFERLAITDASGNWNAGVRAAVAPYTVLFLPPEGQGFISDSYPAVACGAIQNHAFAAGTEITGSVVDNNFNGIPFAGVEAFDGMSDFSEVTLTDENGNYSLRAPAMTSVTVATRAPIGSRWVNESGIVVQTNTNPTVAPQIQLDQGFLFAGRALGGVLKPLETDRSGVGAAVIALSNTGPDFGLSETEQCSGCFSVAVPSGDYRVEIAPLNLDVDESTLITPVVIDRDMTAEYDILVFDRSPLQYTGPEPRGAWDLESRARVGQPVLIQGENLSGTAASVNFPGGPMGLPGMDPVFDAGRGLALVKVPAGAQSGEMTLGVDGTFSTAESSLPFVLEPGVFDPGSFTLSGTITGSAAPLSGAVVVLLVTDPNDPDCDPDGEIHDYVVTDGSGSFSLSHPGGDLRLLIFPPTASTFATMTDLLTLAGDLTGYSADLSPGQALTVRVLADSPPVPVPNVTVEAEGSEFDLRLTAPDGTATMYLPAGSYDVFLTGPFGSRLVGQELSTAVPVDLGDVVMASGPLTGGRAVDDNGDPVAAAFFETSADVSPFNTYGEGLTGTDGFVVGPVQTSTPFRVFVGGPTDSLADVSINGGALVADTYTYPSVELPPAGAVEGSITDLVTGATIPQIPISVNEDFGGSFGAFSGFSESCDDGDYHVKVATGAHFVGANIGESPAYYESYYPSDFCDNVPGSVNVVEGMVTGSIDMELIPKTVTPRCTVLGNVSTRGQVGSGADQLIGGIIVDGVVNKRLLFRALGPTLTGLGVPGALANPQLVLTDVGGTVLATNDDWRLGGQEAEILATGLAPDDLEPVIIADLPPGNYTPIVSGVGLAPGGATGVGIVEVYEIDGSAVTRLTNVSTRGQVGTGADQLIGGFVVQGPASKTVLVRALGPTLTGLGVPGALANPQLVLTTVGGTVLASNDDWTTGTQVTEIMATGLQPPDGTEPAILIDLPPGGYTPIVSGVAGGTGVGIVEIYEIITP